MRVINIPITTTAEQRAELQTILSNEFRKNILKKIGFVKEEANEVIAEEEGEQNGND